MVKIKIGREKMQHDFLAQRETKGLKGILALMVLMSHLSARVKLFSASLLGTMFSAFGYLAVSMFFFLSAYGLFSHYLQAGTAYIKTFPKKKILPFYAVCFSVIAIYMLRDLVCTGTVDWRVLLQSFLFGKTIVDSGWYLQAQLILYGVFYLALRFGKQKEILWVSVFTAVYCLCCVALKLTSTWYEAVFCFPAGILCAKYKAQVVDFFANKKRWWLCICGFGMMLLVTLLFGNKTILPMVGRIPVKMLSSLCFVGCVTVAVTRIKTANPITLFLGEISLEIYVLQGLFLFGLRPAISNDWLYMGTVFLGVLILAWCTHPIFSAISRLVTTGKLRK